jgi:WD40 repeat protein
VLETATGKSIRRLGPHELTVTAVAAAGKDQFATGARDGCIRVFDDGGRVHRSWRDSRCHAATATADGQLLAFAVGNGLIKVWSSDGQAQGTLRGHKSEVQALAFTPDGGSLLAGGADRSIHCIDPGTGKLIGKVAGHTAAITALAVSSDGSRVVSADAGGTLAVWQRRSRSQPLAATPTAPAVLQAARP